MANRLLRSGLIAANRRPGAANSVCGERRVIAEGLRHNPWTDLYHTAMVGDLAGVPRRAGGDLRRAQRRFRAAVHARRQRRSPTPVPAISPTCSFSASRRSRPPATAICIRRRLYGHVRRDGRRIFVSLVATAAMTGLMFARFARPRARLIFARNPVVFEHDGVDTLDAAHRQRAQQFHQRGDGQIWLLGPSVSQEGRRYRRIPADAAAEGRKSRLRIELDVVSSDRRGLRRCTASQRRRMRSTTRSISSSAFPGSTRFLRRSCMRGMFTPLKTYAGSHEFVDMFRRDENGRSHVDFSKVHDTQPVKPEIKDA